MEDMLGQRDGVGGEEVEARFVRAHALVRLDDGYSSKTYLFQKESFHPHHQPLAYKEAESQEGEKKKEQGELTVLRCVVALSSNALSFLSGPPTQTTRTQRGAHLQGKSSRYAGQSLVRRKAEHQR